MKTCPHCGHKIRQKLHTYSSGDGCLTLTWREDTRNAPSSGRQVTRQDALRSLTSYENANLAARNWLPVLINGKWVLARHVKRIGPNRLRISGHSYDYKINMLRADSGRVEDYNLETTFKGWRLAKGSWKYPTQVLKNGSIRMVIRFFLNHEMELKPFFKAHKVLKLPKGEI